MADAYPSPEPSPGEAGFDTPSDLFEYIQVQFEAAYQKERGEDGRGITAPNGAFYKRVPLPGSGQHELVRDSTRIVMCPPYSTLVHGQKAEFVELHAIFLQGSDGHIVADEGGLFADQYLVRRFVDGKFKPYELVEEDGVFPADVGVFDATAGYGRLPEDEVPDIDTQVEQVFRPFVAAQELYRLLSTYNIVATSD